MKLYSTHISMVAPWKFFFLSVVTIGIYPIVWVYQAWTFLRRVYKVPMFPLLGALLWMLWPMLFLYLTRFAKAKGMQFDFSVPLFIGAWIALRFTSVLEFPWMLFSVLSVLPMLSFVKVFEFLVTAHVPLPIKYHYKLQFWELILVCFCIPMNLLFLEQLGLANFGILELMPKNTP